MTTYEVDILHLDMKSGFTRTKEGFEIQMGDPDNDAWNRHPTEAEVEEHYDEVWSGELTFEDVGDSEDPSPPPGTNPVKHFLGLLHTHIEVGGPDCAVPRLVTEENSIRSFMVGDMVRVNGEAWVCDRFGWSKWEPDEFAGQDIAEANV